MHDLSFRRPWCSRFPIRMSNGWLMLDGAAFRAVLGRGCDAPDRKCSRDRYKYLLAEAVHASGIAPDFGGIEFARDIVSRMDIDRAARADPSLRRFVDDLSHGFSRIHEAWRLTEGIDP